jgi:hypothetical protein
MLKLSDPLGRGVLGLLSGHRKVCPQTVLGHRRFLCHTLCPRRMNPAIHSWHFDGCESGWDHQRDPSIWAGVGQLGFLSSTNSPGSILSSLPFVGAGKKLIANSSKRKRAQN